MHSSTFIQLYEELFWINTDSSCSTALYFTHSSISWIESYEITSLAPTTSSTDLSQFLNYAPYGQWMVELNTLQAQNFSLSDVSRLTFYFYVAYSEYGGGNPANDVMFGGDQAQTFYPPINNNYGR